MFATVNKNILHIHICSYILFVIMCTKLILKLIKMHTFYKHQFLTDAIYKSKKCKTYIIMQYI
jgi:hypothetical protein